jgi:hypothetical protein
MSRKLLVLMVLVLSSASLALAGTADVNIHVTPGVTTTLTAETTYYNFNSVNVAQSSHSITGIVLVNAGSVQVDLEKAFTDDGSYTMADPVDGNNEVLLWCVGNETSMPSIGVFGASHKFDTAQDTFNDLTTSGGALIQLVGGAKTTTWYRIDMPPTVTNSDPLTIKIQFQSTETP